MFTDLLKLRDIKEQTEAQESQLKQRVQNALGDATTALFTACILLP